MKYRINRTNHKEFKTIELNKRAPHAYFIPYSSKKKLAKTSLRDERTSSDIVRVLSGEWEFKYYSDKALLPITLDTASTDFDKITVPFTWQRRGYEPPVYLNCPYPFDDAPPHLPKEMSVGVYRKTFDVDRLNRKYIIAFLGVIPCVDLYINGKFVGYSEGAHNTAEFDLTDFVVKGENELVAVVYKWSTATFLECQDMFRENGIFRDVLLYELPETFIDDYHVKTSKSGSCYDLSVEISLIGDTDGCEIEAEFALDNQTIVGKTVTADNKTIISFSALDVLEWNAEVPAVYQLYITLLKDGTELETLRNYTGFKRINIDKTVFTFNDKKIKLKGVNHHDTHYKNGYVMSFDDLEADIKLMKSLNVNAVRTSHYPPDALFLTLCDIYGLYVIDEADIETHGACYPPHNNINLLSNSKRWIPRYLDRVLRMYYRDRNHPCITMWSLGNEAGGWACQDACCAELKKLCPEIPVHYEGVYHTPRHSYDVNSEMYPHVSHLLEIKNRTTGKRFFAQKPLYLCEYCHAMGVGPGSLEDYWQMFYSDDIFMGGCIWEWADHAIYHEDGPLKFTYGGDHGEKKHDGSFCVDGLNYPDRKPHTGALEMRAVYRPLRAALTSSNTFTFTNTNRFRSSDYIKIKWVLLENGAEVKSGSFRVSAEPCCTAEHEITQLPKLKDGNEYHISFIYFDEYGNEIAVEQLPLKECFREIACDCGTAVTVSDSKNLFTASFDCGKAVFSKADGALVSYEINGSELLNTSSADNKGFVPNIFRAPLDNDVHYRDDWRKLGFADFDLKLISFSTDTENLNTVISVVYDLEKEEKAFYRVKITYTVLKNGFIDVSAQLILTENTPAAPLARFGLMLEIDRSLENVEYYGLGEYENLPDFKAQATLGIYKTTVPEMNEPYIKPQDNGNHGETRYLKFTNGDGKGIMFCNAPENFSFSAHNYTQKQLSAALHQEDLFDQNTTAVSIDGFVMGTGSGSCGPDTFDEYRIKSDNGLSFKFTVAPIF